MLTPDRKTCEVNGINMSYLSSGAGVPFLMLHGLLSNALDFSFQFDEFRNRFSCLAPDIRGAGMTETPDPGSASFHRAVDDILEFITAAIPLERRFVLLGHSYGGIISLELLSRIPERITAVIFISSPAAISDKLLSRTGISLYESVLPVIRHVVRFNHLVDFYSQFININPLNLTPQLRQLLSARNRLLSENDMVAMKGYLDSVLNWEPPSFPKHFNIPSALFYGDRDILFSRKDVSRLRKHLPDINISRIDGTGHSCMHEKPDVFNSCLTEFLDRCEI